MGFFENVCLTVDYRGHVLWTLTQKDSVLVN